jgi:trimeric autotransporter adhesin
MGVGDGPRNCPLRLCATSVRNEHLALRPPIRTLRVGRNSVVALVFALCALLVLSAASPASAVTRKQANKKALAALGSANATGPVTVLGLPKPLKSGTRVTQEGKKKVLARVGRERAYLLYQDLAPGQPFPHAGRVALVGVKSGKVKLTGTLSRRPLINGRVPAFLKSARAYRDGDYVVYSTSSCDSVDPSASLGPSPAAGEPFPIDIPGVNQPPVAHDQFATVKLDSPKHITLTASDPDISNGGESNDLLTFEVTKPPNFGTLSGQPPNLVYTPNPGRLGPDHFFFTATDGNGLTSKEGKVTLDVVQRGAAPAVTTSAGCTEYPEQEPGVAIDGALTVSDPDDTVLDSAVVQVGTGFERGDDLLFTDQSGIAGSYNDNTGTLQLVGDATVAAYQAALRSVRYQNLSGGTPATTKNIVFTVNDAGNDSAPATKQVCVTENGGLNNRPVVGTSEGGLSYTENDGPVAIDPARLLPDDPEDPEDVPTLAGGVSVTDPDSAQLSQATVRFTVSETSGGDDPNTIGDGEGNPIGTGGGGSAGDPVNNFAPSEDELAFTDQNGITGSYDDVNGVLTLSGTASVAAYQDALRSVTYENESEDPSDAPRTVRFQVKDSSGLSSLGANYGIYVTPVNDAPTVTPSEGSGAYTEDEPASPVDAAVDADDVDSDNLVSAQVRISAGLQSGDELIYTDQAGITGSYDAENGVLTLIGNAPVADYDTALQSIEFRHVGDDPDPSRTVEYVVNDGELDSVAATRGIVVTPVNDAPVVTTSEGATPYTENEPATVIDSAVSATDVDDDDLESAEVRISSGFQSGDDLVYVDQLGIAGEYNTGTGVLTLTGTAPKADYETALRSVSFASTNDDPETTKTVEFVVNDGEADSNAGAKDVAVTPVNDAPSVATSDGASSYTENEPASAVDSALTVADADDDDLEAARVSIASGLQSGDELVFTDQSGITGEYSTVTGVLTLTGTATVAEYEIALRSVEFRHTGDTPDPSRSVEFVVGDGELDSAAATKSVDVIAVNDAPVVTTTAGSAAYTEGTPATVIDSAVTATDVDDSQLEKAEVRIGAGFQSGDDLVYVDQLGIAGEYNTGTGVLSLTGTASKADYETALRSVTFSTSNDDPEATKTIEFVVNDGEADSNAGARDVAVTGTNDAPIVATSEGSTSYEIGGSGVAVDSGLTVGDPDDTELTGAEVSISGFESGDDLVFVDQNGIEGTYSTGTGVLSLSGTASVSDYENALRSIEFGTTNASPSSSRSIDFKVNDGDVDSATASKSISLVQPNQAPVVTTSSGNSTYTIGDTTGVAIDGALTVADADDTILEGAVVRIQDIQSGDELLFTDQAGITGTIDETGFLILSGTATVAEYETALRSVKFRNSTLTAPGSRTVEFEATDGTDSSAAALKGVDIVAPPL